jgi:hypothetical protein
MKQAMGHCNNSALAQRLKWVIALVFLAMVLLPFAVQAGPFQFTINNQVVTITGFTGGDGRVFVPATIQGKRVVAIGPYAFGSVVQLVRIPSTVTNIGTGAFAACYKLGSFRVNGSRAYTSDADVLMDKEKTIIVRYPPRRAGPAYQVPNTVTNIADYAFESCTHLQGIYFEGNAPALGSSVFLGDSGITIYYVQGTSGWGPSYGGFPTATWTPK